MSRVCAFAVLLLLPACGPATTGVGDESATDTAGTDETETETGTGEQDTDTEDEGEGEGEGETGGGASCGNGIIEEDELCDADNLGNEDCMSLGFVGGELTCSDNCNFDATACTSSVCGNGTAERDEECDGVDYGGLNCVDLGFGPGLPTCTAACTFDTSTCPTAGEGESCGTLSPCPNNLNCVSNTCYDGSVGDPCDNDGDCESNDCVGATLFQDGTCS